MKLRMVRQDRAYNPEMGALMTYFKNREYEVPEVTGRALVSAGSAVPTEVDEGKGLGRPAPVPEWPLKMSPEDYARLKPDGPRAPLARSILEAEEGE